MTEKKISRRDAMKILGAAIGGAALSTLPPQWSKPALAASQLPEHARQSAYGAYNIVADADVINGLGCSNSQMTSTATVTPHTAEFLLRYDIAGSDASVTFTTPTPGTVLTVNGVATVTVQGFSTGSGTLTVTWSFANPADGTASASQAFTNGGC
jgi:hypothetical protein